MKNIIVLLSVLSALFLSECSNPESADDGSDWINKSITKFENGPASESPLSIWRYTYRDQTVYYFVARCCDQYNTLYDKHGNFLCAPSGGITGAGDRKCPDFYNNRKNEKLIWTDKRRD